MAHYDEQPAGADEKESFELIRDPSQIIRFLQKALLEDENVEIQINDRTRTFFTFFMDHPPELVPVEPPAGSEPDPTREPEMVEPNYEPLSYLRERDHLVISPLVPAIGNAHIRNSHDVVMRFFQGVKAVESTVTFLGTMMVRGEPALKLSFPKNFRMLRKRRHFRAKVTAETEVLVSLHKPGMEPLVVTLIDISVGGMAFCNFINPELLPINTMLQVKLQAAGMEAVKVSAFVRNHTKASAKDGCPGDSDRCGLQFDVMSEKQAMQVEEVVAYVQREQLQEIQERKAGMAKKGPKLVRKKKAHHEEESFTAELGRFFGIKKGYNFKK